MISCGNYIMSVIIEVERKNTPRFRFNVLESVSLKSDNKQELPFTNNDVCQRGQKGPQDMMEGSSTQDSTSTQTSTLTTNNMVHYILNYRVYRFFLV